MDIKGKLGNYFVKLDNIIMDDKTLFKYLIQLYMTMTRIWGKLIYYLLSAYEINILINIKKLKELNKETCLQGNIFFANITLVDIIICKRYTLCSTFVNHVNNC